MKPSDDPNHYDQFESLESAAKALSNRLCEGEDKSYLSLEHVKLMDKLEHIRAMKLIAKSKALRETLKKEYNI